MRPSSGRARSIGERLFPGRRRAERLREPPAHHVGGVLAPDVVLGGALNRGPERLVPVELDDLVDELAVVARDQGLAAILETEAGGAHRRDDGGIPWLIASMSFRLMPAPNRRGTTKTRHFS